MERILKDNSLFVIESILDNSVASLANYELTDELVSKLVSKEISIDEIDLTKLNRVAKNVVLHVENGTEYLKSMFGISNSENTSNLNTIFNSVIQKSNNAILDLSQLKEKSLTQDEKDTIILHVIEEIREIRKLSLNIQESI
jgi:hypothetical protein